MADGGEGEEDERAPSVLLSQRAKQGLVQQAEEALLVTDRDSNPRAEAQVQIVFLSYFLTFLKILQSFSFSPKNVSLSQRKLQIKHVGRKKGRATKN